MFWYIWWSVPIQESSRSLPRITSLEHKTLLVLYQLGTYEGLRSPVSETRSKTNIRIQDAPRILMTQKITRILGSLCPGPGAEASIFVFYAFIEITEKFWVVVGSFSCHTVACSFLGLTAWPPREIISPCSEHLPYSMSVRESISIPSGGADSASAQRENPFLAIIFSLSSAMISRKQNKNSYWRKCLSPKERWLLSQA